MLDLHEHVKMILLGISCVISRPFYLKMHTCDSSHQTVKQTAHTLCAVDSAVIRLDYYIPLSLVINVVTSQVSKT